MAALTEPGGGRQARSLCGRPASRSNSCRDGIGLDPGRLDTIEVGEATPAPGSSGASLVPFRIVDVDGGQVAGIATVGAATPARPNRGGDQPGAARSRGSQGKQLDRRTDLRAGLARCPRRRGDPLSCSPSASWCSCVGPRRARPASPDPGGLPREGERRRGGQVDRGLRVGVGLHVVAELGAAAVEPREQVDAVRPGRPHPVDETRARLRRSGPRPRPRRAPARDPSSEPARFATWCWRQCGNVVPSPTIRDRPHAFAPRMFASQRSASSRVGRRAGELVVLARHHGEAGAVGGGVPDVPGEPEPERIAGAVRDRRVERLAACRRGAPPA